MTSPSHFEIFRSISASQGDIVEEFHEQTGAEVDEPRKAYLRLVCTKRAEVSGPILTLPLTKEVADLDEHDRLAIAIGAGCEFDTFVGQVEDKLKLTIRTKNLISIVKIGPYYHVLERSPGGEGYR